MHIKDLNSCRPVDRIQDTVLLTPETNSALTLLANLLSHEDNNPTPLPIREYERKYKQWVNDPAMPQEIRNKANRVGISNGYDAAMQYYRSVFDALNPQLKPSGKPGRPEWYVSPVRAKRIARGDVIALLINLGAETLAAQFKKAA